MQIQIFFIFLSSLFILGGIATAIVAQKQDKKERKNAWVKYFMYLGIIFSLFFAICFYPFIFKALCGIVILGGAFELIKLQYIKLRLPNRLFFSWIVIYIVICAAFFQLCFSEINLILFTLLTVCSFDAFSQLSGQLFGKRKIFPKISPNKTLEGLIGGIILSLTVSLIVGKMLEWTIVNSVLLGLGIAISSFFGDLSASYIKRQYKVKDFSNIIPGHGGFLDRFDSLILSGTFVYIAQLSINDRQLFSVIIFIVGYLFFIGFCEFLNQKRHITSEYTRKMAHIVTSLSALSFPYVFSDYYYVLGLCAFCFIVFLVANLTRMFHSIDNVERRTGGSYLLALAVGVTYYLRVIYQDSTIYNLSILILAICDPLAGVVGKHISSKQLINNKTLMGSLIFLVSAFTISIIYLCKNEYEHTLKMSIFIACSSMLVELFSPRGTDNITVPFTVSLILIAFY